MSLPKIAADWISYFEEQNPWWIDNAKALDCGHVLRYNGVSRSSRVEQSFVIPAFGKLMG